MKKKSEWRMTQTQANRLARHYRFMAGVPEKGVIMGAFYGLIPDKGEFGYRTTHPEGIEPPQRQDASCGTAACIAGWWPVSDPKNWKVKTKNHSFYGRVIKPVLRKNPRITGLEAVQKFLDLDMRAVSYMCETEYYEDDEKKNEPKRKDVLKHMALVGKRYGWDVTKNGKATPLPKWSEADNPYTDEWYEDDSWTGRRWWEALGGTLT